MLYHIYQSIYNGLGLYFWDIPIFLILIVVIAVFAVKRHKMKREEKDLEDRLSGLYTDETVKIDSKT